MTTETNWKESAYARLQEMELTAEAKRDKAEAEIEEIIGISDPITFNKLRVLFGTWEAQDEKATLYGERLSNFF